MRQLYQTRTVILLVAPAFIFMTVLFLIPLVYLISQSLVADDGALSISGYSDFFSSRTSQLVYWRTVRLSLIVTVICAVLGYPASYVLARMSATRRSILMSLIILPLMTNSVARTYAWLIILGRQGIVNSLLLSLGLVQQPLRFIFTEEAIVIGLAQLFIPLMVLPLVSAMENIPDDMTEAARSLGASGLTAFLRVTVPLSLDGLVLGATLVFTGSVTAYTTAAVLGGSRTLLLSTLLRQEALVTFDVRSAAVIAVVMMLTALAVNIVLRVIRVRYQ
jgi:putative spermidine/putrescine transport system permease protein